MRKRCALERGCLESKEPTRYPSTAGQHKAPGVQSPGRHPAPGPSQDPRPHPAEATAPRTPRSLLELQAEPRASRPTQARLAAHPDCSGWSPEGPGRCSPRSKSGQCPRSPASHSVTHLVPTSRSPRGRLAPARSTPTAPDPDPDERSVAGRPRVRIRLRRVPIQIQAGIQTWRSAL